jgi:hypothetical protein
MLVKLPNDALPNANLRTKLLKIISELPITSDILVDSKAGKILVSLEKSKEELESNKRLIREIKDKWSRIVCGLYINYAELEREEYESARVALRKRQQVEGERADAELMTNSTNLEASRVRRMKRRYDFVARPKSNFEIQKFEKSNVS